MASVQMTKVNGNVWSYTIANGSTGVLFHNGSGTQTDDFTPVAGHIYNLSGDQGVYTPGQGGGEQGGGQGGGEQGGGETPGPVTGLSGTLPVLYINVYNADKSGYDNAVIDMNLADKDYRSGEYWLDINGCEWLADLGAASIGSAESPLPLEIKARGNYTRIGFSKKPYKLKLGAKQNMLNMNVEGQKSKHWALLTAADDDKGYLRNFVGFRLGELIGLPWTPRQQPVEVVINGDYRGLYFLTESIRVEKGRINITELKDSETDRTKISGGYVVELDNYEDENQISMAEKRVPGTPYSYDPLRVTFNTPEVYSPLQRQFIEQQFSTMNDLIANCNNSDDLWKYLDLDDAVRYYLVMEVISHWESYHGSTYLFRDFGEGQKWHFSPIWDCGHAFERSTSEYFYNQADYGNTWIPSMRTNSTFNAKLAETWKWFMTNDYKLLMADIEAFVNHVSAAAVADHARWGNAPMPADGSPVADNSNMQGRKDEVLSHLNDKINWLKSQWGYYSDTDNFAEPERDTTEPAPLPEFVDPNYVPTYLYVHKEDDSWSNLRVYLYNDANSTEWPGIEFTDADYNADLVYADGEGNIHHGLYCIEIPYEYRSARVIFSSGGNSPRYPAAGEPGMEYDNCSIIFCTSWQKIDTNPEVSYYKEPGNYSGTLPVLRIVLPQGSAIGYGDDGEVAGASFKLDMLDGNAPLEFTGAIKGRGSDSWANYDKKSYKLTLDKKQAPLGIAKSKHFALMAYADDAANALLSNYAAHEISRLMGMTWTPTMEPVEVTLNGEYIGLYFLCENVRVAAERINIPDYGDKGYDYTAHMLLEFDDLAANPDYSWEENGATHHVVASTPDFSNAKVQADANYEAMLQTVASAVDSIREAAAYAKANPRDNSWKKFFDLEQAVRYYVVQEIMDCADAYNSSLYMWHSDDGLWRFGPVWDFGASFSGDYYYKEGLIHESNNGLFIGDLYANDYFRYYTVLSFLKFVDGGYPTLAAGARLAAPMLAEESESEVYNPEFDGTINDVYASVIAMGDKIASAAAADAAVWPDYAAVGEGDDTVAARALNVVQKMAGNVSYLKNGAPKWNYEDVITGIHSVAVDASVGAPTEYFDLCGRRIDTPAPGTFCIVRRGAEVAKVIIR